MLLAITQGNISNAAPVTTSKFSRILRNISFQNKSAVSHSARCAGHAVTRIVCRLLLTVSATLLLAPASWAQYSADLTGIVADASGSVIVGAEVRLISKDTGIIHTSQTSDAGLYVFTALQPGVYDVEVTKTGFEKFVKTDLKLEVGQGARLDIPLAVGNVNQSITVNGSTEILQTTTSSVSQEVQGRQVEDMPLNGRNVMNLVTLAPGVVAQGSTSGATMSNQLGGALSQPGGWGNCPRGKPLVRPVRLEEV